MPSQMRARPSLRVRAGEPQRTRAGRGRWVLAAALGLLGALAWVLLGRSAPPGAPPALHPRIHTWVFHFQPSRQDSVIPACLDVLAAAPADNRFVIAVQGEAHERRCRELLGPTHGSDPRVSYVHVDGPLAPWARDSYVPFEREGTDWIYAPPARAVHAMDRGSLQMPALLAKLRGATQVVSGDLDLQGGDILLTPRRVFVSGHTFARNSDRSAAQNQRFRQRMEDLFGRTLLVVGKDRERLPYDHLDMFLTVVEEDRVLLGDPLWGAELLEAAGAWNAEGAHAHGELGTFRRATQQVFASRYEGVEAELRAAGFRVDRLPILHGEPLGTERRGSIVNWNNAVLTVREGMRRAYVPHYRWAGVDERAHAVWRDRGWEVVPVDVRAAISRGGGVRCLTQVLR